MQYRKMMTQVTLVVGVALAAVFTVQAARTPAVAGDLAGGASGLKSAGALAFGPDGVLFVGDSIGGAIVALDTADQTPCSSAKINVQGIDEKIAALVGVMPDRDPDQRRRRQPDLEERLRVGGARPRPRRRAAGRPRRAVGQADAAVARQHHARIGQPGDAPADEPGGPPESADDDHHRHGVRQRQPAGGRHVERGVVLGAALDSVSVQQRRQGHAAPDLARLARALRDPVAGADVRAVHASTASSTSSPPTPARRS